jgi:hypothetical protein
LALTALFLIPSLKPESASELFPFRSGLDAIPSDPDAFTIVCPPPPPFTTYELAGVVTVIAAIILWLISAALMVRDRERIVGIFVKEAMMRVRHMRALWQPTFR